MQLRSVQPTADQQTPATTDQIKDVASVRLFNVCMQVSEVVMYRSSYLMVTLSPAHQWSHRSQNVETLMVKHGDWCCGGGSINNSGGFQRLNFVPPDLAAGHISLCVLYCWNINNVGPSFLFQRTKPVGAVVTIWTCRVRTVMSGGIQSPTGLVLFRQVGLGGGCRAMLGGHGPSLVWGTCPPSFLLPLLTDKISSKHAARAGSTFP